MVTFPKMSQTYLSKRRRVESKQPARMQLPSFDIDTQLTGCPKLSETSLVDRKDNITVEINFTTATKVSHIFYLKRNK